MKPYAFGVDIGGTTIKMGFFSSDGKFIDHWEIPTHTENNGEKVLPDIARSIKKKLKDNSITLDDLEGVGVGVPGPVLSDGVVNKCVNLGWGVIDIAAEMSRLTGIENIHAGNDANVAALGEIWQGGGKGNKNLVMVTLGTGVGGGIILGGRIIPGAFGAAGEIGHFTMTRHETMSCGCGKKGHLEQYVSATGIARKAQELLSESNRPSALRDAQYLSAKEVFECAKNGDELSLEIVEFVGDTLGRALASISCVVDPDIFLIGGGVSKAGDILLDTIQTHFRKYAFHASENVKFALATLGNDAGMYGAVKMVL